MKAEKKPSPASEMQACISESPGFLLNALVDSCDDAIISKDLGGIICSWNGAAIRLFGYEPDEMIGRSMLALIPEDLEGEEAEMLAKVKAGERIDHYETTRLKKNGGLINVSLTVSPIRNDRGKIIGSSNIAHDLSERARTDETALRLAAIVESSDDAILSKNLDGIITSWNKGATCIFGYAAEEMIGQSVLRLIPETLHAEEQAILRKMRSGGRLDHYETKRVNKRGEILDISMTISPIKDRSGRLIGTSKIARDITAQKQMERLLIRSGKLAATGRMASTIAHEINNPLESVMNLVFLARRGSPTKSQARGYLQTAEAELERISHITRQTLGYCRDNGKPLEVDLHELVQDVLSLYHSKLHNRAIGVECQFEPCRTLVIRKGELMQVLSNLLANSIDAMPQGGSLKFAVKETTVDGRCGAQVVIQDRGTGIPEEDLKNVFDPFFSTKGDSGTGIGLWVAKQLIEGQGGVIEISSTTVSGNSGTSVCIFLPFAQDEKALLKPLDNTLYWTEDTITIDA